MKSFHGKYVWLLIGAAILSAFCAMTVALIAPSLVSAASTLNTVCPPSIPTHTLKKGQISPDVKSLQTILNMSVDTEVAVVGSGSPGHESTYFGLLTQAAVIRFQNKYASTILFPVGLKKGTGYVGSSTLAKLAALCAPDLSQQPTNSTLSFSVANLSTSASSLSTSSVSIANTATSSTISTNVPDTTTGNSNPTNSTTGATLHSHNHTPQNPGATSGSSSTTTSNISSTPTLPSVSGSHLQWGAYVGDGATALSDFESQVGKPVNILATFDGWDSGFPTNYSSTVGAAGKTLVLFWEPSFGYDTIISGSEDSYISQFANQAKSYGYPIILAPFDEMNLNEQAWGYGQNGNTAGKFVTAWQHIHDLFAQAGANNVKFALTYNNVSVPNISGNSFNDYYPGANYVDYVAVDGFNFGNPWQSFEQVFDQAISSLSSFGKPIYILSTGSAAGSARAAWITDGLGVRIQTYSQVVGWVWFNQNDATVPGSGDTVNWQITSDSATLQAFQSVLP